MWIPARRSLVALLAAAPLAHAGVPEPDVIYYGTLTIASQLQTTSSTASVEIRKSGQAPLSTGIEDRGSGPIYVARIGLENSAGVASGCTGFCAAFGDSLEVWVVDGAAETHVAQLELGARGRIVALDLDVPSDLATLDLDTDGRPNFLDNCRLANPSQADADGDGIGDACEALIPSDIVAGEHFAAVADVSNAADPATGLGAVDYSYALGITEVSNAQYAEFLNAVADSDPNGLFSESMAIDPRGGITRTGSYGSYSYAVKPQMADKPVGFVSWLDAARFANWLENGATSSASSTENGAFDLSVPDPAINAVAAPAAQWSLPTEEEWYKAAYYDPANGYWVYPTGEDVQPLPATADGEGDVANPAQAVANYASAAVWNGQDGNVTSVGSATSTTFYGHLDMAGNVAEWLADDADLGNRRGRGGGFADTRFALESTAVPAERDRDPSYEGADVGVRLVLVPEPATAWLGLGALGALFGLRKRSQRS